MYEITYIKNKKVEEKVKNKKEKDRRIYSYMLARVRLETCQLYVTEPGKGKP